MISIEKTEHYAQLSITSTNFDDEVSSDLEKKVVELYKEGFMSIIIDCSPVTEMIEKGITLIKKINTLLQKESGILVIVSKEYDITDQLKEAEIEDLVILSTLEEAIDAIFMNELENDFKEEDDDEFDMEDGFGIEG